MTRGDTNKPETFEAVKQGYEEMLQLLKVGTAVGGNGEPSKGLVVGSVAPYWACHCRAEPSWKWEVLCQNGDHTNVMERVGETFCTKRS